MRKLGLLGSAQLGVGLLLASSAQAQSCQAPAYYARPKEEDGAEQLSAARTLTRSAITLVGPTAPLVAADFTPGLTRRRQPSDDPAVAERRAQIKRLLNPKRA